MATLKINGNEYFYEDHGPKEAPCIVLSPLLYTDTSVFEPLVRMLSDEFRVITYDHRGLGRTSGPASKDLSSSAKDVAELLKQLKVTPCHFVGNCLGAYVGLQLAIQNSDILKSCTLMGVTGEADTLEQVAQMDAYIAKAKAEGMKANVKAFGDMWFGSTFKATKDPIQVSRREKWLSHVSRMKPEELDTAMQVFHRKDVRADLGKISCSVLVLAGDEDTHESIDAYRRLADNISGAEFKLIHHAGYALVIEQPEEVADNVRSFVERVERQWAKKSKETSRDIGARPV